MIKTISLLALLVIVGYVGYTLMNSNEGLKNNEGKVALVKKEKLTPVAIKLGMLALDSDRSVIEWEGRKKFIPGYVDRGTIRVKDGIVVIKDGVAKDGIFTIDMTSIAAVSTGKGSGETMLTEHLKSEDFLDVENYPNVIFSFKKITETETPTIYNVVGDLTIKNKTNEITFPATIGEDEDGFVRVRASLELDRTLWNVRYGSGKFFDNLGDNMIEDMFGLKLDLVFKG